VCCPFAHCNCCYCGAENRRRHGHFARLLSPPLALLYSVFSFSDSCISSAFEMSSSAARRFLEVGRKVVCVGRNYGSVSAASYLLSPPAKQRTHTHEHTHTDTHIRTHTYGHTHTHTHTRMLSICSPSLTSLFLSYLSLFLNPQTHTTPPPNTHQHTHLRSTTADIHLVPCAASTPRRWARRCRPSRCSSSSQRPHCCQWEPATSRLARPRCSSAPLP